MGRKIIFYAFGILMVCIYTGMGGLMLFSTLFNNYSPYLPPVVRYILGTVLMVYGVFRAYRLIRKGDEE